ncbi:hypothetical protein [Streptomyces tauricus]|uniref:hypothetical protein n=1 Tax=Streptomyces tauricus TaxID=68274 RepID=UPI001675EE81|nr:hypothetical protein [Streptomyces tauricus]
MTQDRPRSNTAGRAGRRRRPADDPLVRHPNEKGRDIQAQHVAVTAEAVLNR